MTTKAAPFKAVPTYETDATTVRFAPTDRVPGFTHRVQVIDNATRAVVGVGWLGTGFRPSPKTAKFFAEKFGR